MSKRSKTQTGQALVLVTVSLIAMAGIMGLAVDLGWMFFLKKEAQSAADAAALAAVEEAQQRMGGTFSGFTCPTTASSSTPWCDKSGALECSAGGANVGAASNLYNGCLYAKQNGFSHSVNSKQSVWVQAYDSTSAPPGLAMCTGAGTPSPCYDPTGVAYWVSVNTVQTVPQLFSAVLGNTQGTITATATAAVISTTVPGQFIALNRSGAWIQGKNKLVQGQDIVLAGNSQIIVPGGVLLASNCTSSSQAGCSGVGTTTQGAQSELCSGSGCPSVGNGSVEISTPGAAAGANVDPTAVVGGGPFTDPYQGVSQPPVLPANSNVGGCSIKGGTITGGSGSNYLILGPRQYYAVNNQGNATGAPITLTGNIAFDPNSTGCASMAQGIATSTGAAATGAFSAFYFYGGLNVQGTTYFGPGEYVMVGANSAEPGTLLTMGASTVTGSGTGSGSGVNTPATVPSGVTADTGAGTLFVMTNPSYSSGLGTTAPTGVAALTSNLGTLSMQAGNTSSISLAGLDRSVSSVPSSLGQYNGLLMWQDRADSSIAYNSSGYVTSSPTCTTVLNCNPNAPTPSTLDAETIQFQAHPNLSLAGVIYQPQGASINFQGNGGITAALQIITGGVVSTGGASVQLTSVQNPAIRYVVALIH